MKRFIAACLMCAVSLISVCAYDMLCSADSTAEPEHILRIALWDYESTRYDRELVQAFEAENPDVEVEVISYRGEVYSQNIQAMLESGANVDIVYTNEMDMVTKLEEQKFCLPIDNLASRDRMDLTQYKYSEFLCNSDGEQIALPYRMDRFLLYYNKDLFDEAGIPYPNDDMTWDDFYQTATELQQYLDRQGKGQYSLFSLYIPMHWTDFLTSRPFSVENMDVEQLKNGLSMLIRMQQEGSMVPMNAIRSQRGVQRMFESGDYGMYICGTWLMHYFQIDSETGNCTMNWDAVERPHWEGVINENPAWMTSLCINRQSQETEAAWRFLQFVCGKRGAQIMARNLMIPAYRDADVNRMLQEQIHTYDITADLSASSFDPPQAVASVRESEARTSVLSLVGEAMLGLRSEEDCFKQIAQIRSKLFSQNFVESYNN